MTLESQRSSTHGARQLIWVLVLALTADL